MVLLFKLDLGFIIAGFKQLQAQEPLAMLIAQSKLLMPMLMLAYKRCLESLSGAYRGAFEGALRCMVIVILSKILSV